MTEPLCIHGVSSQEQCGGLVDLLRQFHGLRASLSTTVENAKSLTHNQPDHNHNPEEARRTLSRVRTIQVILVNLPCL